MTITDAQIKYFSKGNLRSAEIDNIRHIKVLPYLSVVQSVEGSYDFSLENGTPLKTGKGGFFIAPSDMQQNIVHHVDNESGKMIARWIFIDVVINNLQKIDYRYKFPAVITSGIKCELNELFDRLFATDDVLDNYGDVYKVLSLLVKNAVPVKKEPNKDLQNAVNHIKNNYADKITVKQLADISNMSESNFYATFKKAFGDSPISYLNHYRLSMAAARISETDAAINEIGYESGIEDPLYFSKLFKKTYGISPATYRRMYKNQRD